MKKTVRSQTLESDRDTLSYLVAAFLIFVQVLSEAEHSRINASILVCGTLFLLAVQLLGHFRKFIELERRAESERDHVDTILFRGQRYNTLEDEDAERGLLVHVTGKMHKILMSLSLVLCAGGIVYAFATQPGSVWRLSTSLHLLALMAWSQSYLPRHNVAAVTLGFLAVASTWKPEMTWWQSVQTMAFIPLLVSIMSLRVFQNGIMSGEKNSLLTSARIQQIVKRSIKIGLACICIANTIGWMTSRSQEETFLSSLGKVINKINYKAGELAVKFSQKRLDSALSAGLDGSRSQFNSESNSQSHSQSNSLDWTTSGKDSAGSGATGHPAGETDEGATSNASTGTPNPPAPKTTPNSALHQDLQPSANQNSSGEGSAASSGESSPSSGPPQVSPELAQSLLKGLAEAQGQGATGVAQSGSPSTGIGSTATGAADNGNSKGAGSGARTGTEESSQAASNPNTNKAAENPGRDISPKAESSQPREVQPLIDPKKIERWTPWVRLLIVIGIMALVVLLIEPLFRRKKKEEEILDQDLPPELAKEVLKGLRTLQRGTLSVEDEIRIRYLTFLNIMQILRNPRPEYLPTWEFYAEVRVRHEQIDPSARVMTDVFSRFTYGKEIPSTAGLNEYRAAFLEIEKRTLALVLAYEKAA